MMEQLYFLFGTPGMGEIIVVLVIGLLLFGGAKLPEIARSLGSGIKEFKRTMNDLNSSDKD